jgi:small GTP-binding protein
MDQKELLRIIAQAAEEGWTALDLSNQGLTELPPEIGKLTNLRTLHLRYNHLSTLPMEIQKLQHLERLGLGDNCFTEVPNEIWELRNLLILYLSANQLVIIPPEIGKLMNLIYLSLRDNKILELPAEIGNLNRLEKLILRGNKLSMLPPEIRNLTHLTELSLNDNLLPIPSEVLLNNEPVKIIDYCLSNQSQAIEKQEFLVEKNISSLSFFNKKLTLFPSEVLKQLNLKKLDLRHNQLTRIPSEIGNLINLIELSLQNNQLAILPAEIGNLKNLTTFGLDSDQFSEFPFEITQLNNIKSLAMSYNQIAELPQEINQLKNLTNFYLGHNHLNTFPEQICDLTNLVNLSVRENQITKLPHRIDKLTNLKRLEITHNQITSLPEEIKNLTNLIRLDLRDNPLPIPPEILALTDQPQKILNYYFQQGQKKPLNEVKVLIVGQGAVGKTSLIKRLLEDTFDPHETKTDGIAINHWRLNIDSSQIRLNVWDFGGQEIMHATHQFFLTKRSLYVLVLDSRLSEQENRLEYWLKIIQSFGGDSPVIVVCNKNDQHDLDLDWKGLQNKYPSLKAFAKTVSCKTGDGIPQLKTQIEREIAQLEHIHDELILPWFAVKTQLEEMQRDYISYCDYQQMCQQADVTDELSQQTLLGFLHDLGIVLHFHDHPLLEDTNVLNPAWVTRGVYQLLNSNELFQRKGELDRAALSRMLDPQTYPAVNTPSSLT